MQEKSPDLFDRVSNAAGGRRILTVSEITQDIKLVLENTFSEVWVEGEISGFNRISTGTIFFSLKDNSSLLKCVMFSSYVLGLKFEIKDGLKVICGGRISVYEKDGKYQLYVEKIEPKGLGSQQLALEQLKQRLEKEGLFSPAHKRPIPYLPAKIGLVTSLQGAAIKDILKVLERRFKDVHIIAFPVRVQGDGAKEEIAQAIKELNVFNEGLRKDERIEVMIVGRGGGSAEDLWAFNEEVVARAIYNSRIPVISAVGHERDWSVADMVADVRAATPSVAAEMVLPKKEDLKDKLLDLTSGLKRAFLDTITGLQEDVDNLAHRLKINIEHVFALNASEFNSLVKKIALLNPALLIRQYQQRAQDYARQIKVRACHLLELKTSEFRKATEKLSGLSPLNILSRGYSITFKIPEGTVVRDIKSVKVGDRVKTRLGKGAISSEVTEIF